MGRGHKQCMCSKNTPSSKFNLLFSAFEMQFPLASNMDNNKEKSELLFHDTIKLYICLFCLLMVWGCLCNRGLLLFQRFKRQRERKGYCLSFSLNVIPEGACICLNIIANVTTLISAYVLPDFQG